MTSTPGKYQRRSTAALDADTEVESHPLSDFSTLRSDAARNLSKILAAARTIFYEEGIDASVETIAQRAGVGMGTLYRRFPTKESLIDAVVDELLQEILAAATDALDSRSPATAFAEFLQNVGQLQADHSGCLGRLWSAARHSPVRAAIEAVARQLLARAQAAGSVRADAVYEDVILLQWSVRGVIETAAPVAPDAWLRHLDLMLAALAPSPAPLRHPPLTAAQIEASVAPRPQTPPAQARSAELP